MNPGFKSRYVELLTRCPGLTAKEIRDALGVWSVSTVAHALRNLQRKGLVRETNDFPAKWFIVEAKGRAA